MYVSENHKIKNKIDKNSKMLDENNLKSIDLIRALID
jgi:hypothetical protein